MKDNKNGLERLEQERGLLEGYSMTTVNLTEPSPGPNA